MGNFSGGFQFLITTIFDIFAFIVMLRFLMQYTRASFANPVGDLIVKATNPFLMPLRKIIPGFKGHDLAALVLVFLILLVKYILLIGISGGGGNVSWVALLPLSLLGVLGTAIDVFIITIIVRVILSWVTPGGHALSGLLDSVTSPILNPVQKFLPPFNGLDLSPLVAILILYFIKIVLGLG